MSTKVQRPPAMPSNMDRIQKAVDAHVRHRYPLMVSDLTKPEMKLLIWVLNIDNTQDFLPRLPEAERIKHAIATLPQVMRRHSLVLRVVSKGRRRARMLCGPHSDLNPFVVHHIFELLDVEIVEHLWKLERCIDLLEPSIREIINELQAMRGMWWLPDDQLIPAPDNTIFQRNRCEACILARVVDEPMYLQNLRTALLARSTLKRAPRLLSFVEEAMNTHANLTSTLFYMSGQLAFDMKAARKEAEDQWCMSKSREEIEALGALAKKREKELQEMQRRNIDSKLQEIRVYMDPESDEGQEVLQAESSKGSDGAGSARRPQDGDDPLVNEISAAYSALSTADDELPPDRDAYPESRFTATPSEYASVCGASELSVAPVAPLSIQKNKPLPPLPKTPLPMDSDFSSAGPPTPSSADKGKGRVSDATEPKQRGKPLPPRDSIDWANELHMRSPIDRALEHAHELYSPRVEGADQHDNLLSPQAVRYSASEYEDAPVREDIPSFVSMDERSPGGPSGPNDTTWSLFMKSGM